MHADGTFVLHAPLYYSEGDAEAFVKRNRAWIEARRREYQSVRLDLSDGAVLRLGGSSRKICTGAPRIFEDRVFLPEKGRSEALVALLKKYTRERMAAFVARLADEYAFIYRSISVTSARGRWGSCSAGGRLSFSFRGAFLDDECARYLAVHELCHTRHMDHGRAFWAEVEAIVPGCKKIRARLKKQNYIMNYL